MSETLQDFPVSPTSGQTEEQHVKRDSRAAVFTFVFILQQARGALILFYSLILCCTLLGYIHDVCTVCSVFFCQCSVKHFGQLINVLISQYIYCT